MVLFNFGCGNEKNYRSASTASPSISPSPTASPTISTTPSPSTTPTSTLTPTPTPMPTSTSSIEDYPKKFYVQSNKIVNESGIEVVFRGVNILDPAWMDGDYYNLNAAYFSQVASWKANIIRIPVHPIGYRYYGPTNYLKILDKAINLAAAHKIYSIIDFHSIGFVPESTYNDFLADPSLPWSGQIYSYTEQEINDFWATIANHYKNDDRVVFYEIFNEPTGRANKTIFDATAWDQWKTSAEALVDLIRNIDPDSKIIVNGINYGYDLSYVGANPVNRSNIVYGTHPYPEQCQNKASAEAFGNLKDIYPVFATEFGFDPSVSASEVFYGTTAEATELINYLESKNISWTVWHFSVEWTPNLLSDWEYNTSASGSLFKTILQVLN